MVASTEDGGCIIPTSTCCLLIRSCSESLLLIWHLWSKVQGNINLVGKSISGLTCGYMIIKTELKELVFYTWKPSSLNSIFMSRPSHPLDKITWGTKLEIESTRLNFRKWSPALYVLPWVPTGDLFPLCPSHYISDRALSTLYTF